MKSVAAQSLKNADTPEEDNEPSEYEVKGHLDTLMNAHEILNNPKKMKHVHALAGRHANAIKGIKSTEDLKKLYKQKYGLGQLKDGVVDDEVKK